MARTDPATIGCVTASALPLVAGAVWVFGTLVLMEYEDSLADHRPGQPFSWESMGPWLSLAFVLRLVCPAMSVAGSLVILLALARHRWRRDPRVEE